MKRKQNTVPTSEQLSIVDNFTPKTKVVRMTKHRVIVGTAFRIDMSDVDVDWTIEIKSLVNPNMKGYEKFETYEDMELAYNNIDDAESLVRFIKTFYTKTQGFELSGIYADERALIAPAGGEQGGMGGGMGGMGDMGGLGGFGGDDMGGGMGGFGADTGGFGMGGDTGGNQFQEESIEEDVDEDETFDQLYASMMDKYK